MFCIKRNFASRPKISLIDDVYNSITKNEYKPKKHPGIIQTKTVSLPQKFLDAAENVLADQPVKALFGSAEQMTKYLKFRLPPLEDIDIKNTVTKAQEDAFSTIKNVQIMNEEDEVRVKQSIKDKTKKFFKVRVYNWQPIKYDFQTSLIYMLARSAQEYAVLVKIMGEIAARDVDFKPRSLFDFGSGIGTGTWAAMEFWKKHIFEYFNVDVSKDMNDLAEALLQGGSTTGTKDISGVFYRQFLPASNTSYDIVICAYSLFELPSAKARMETILNLWNKTGSYLIIVDHGMRAGFQLVNELRDFILQLNEGNSGGYVFSPCPHDHVCPRFLSDKKLQTCHFPVNYTPLPFSSRHDVHHELYSYVVLRRGERDPSAPVWPRMVVPTLVRSKHTICRMCTGEGSLREFIFSKSKHGQPLYYCARKTRWGDLLPVTIHENEGVTLDESNVDNKDDENVT